MASHSGIQKSSSKEEGKLIFQEREHNVISYWWKVFQILFYFTVFIGGISTSIAIANITSSFQLRCILHANLTIKNTEEIPDLDYESNVYQIYTKSIPLLDIYVTEWGNPNDCLFATFSPAAQAAFAFLWGALFLQCGKGGKNSEKGTQDWKIVAPALFFTCAFFIVSIVSLTIVTSGLSGFCNNILENSVNFEANLTSCGEVFSLRFPWDEDGHISLYTNYVIAQTGVVLVFVGWLLAILLLVFRCVTHADFAILKSNTRPGNTPVIPNEPGPSSEEKHRKLHYSSSNSTDSSVSEDEDEDTVIYEGGYNTKKSDEATTVPLISPTKDSFMIKKVK